MPVLVGFFFHPKFEFSMIINRGQVTTRLNKWRSPETVYFDLEHQRSKYYRETCKSALKKEIKGNQFQAWSGRDGDSNDLQRNP